MLIDAIISEPGNAGFVHGFCCGHTWEDVFGEDGPTHLAFMTRSEAQSALKGGE